MSRYFSYFPKFLYSVNDNQSVEYVTNILTRIKFDDNVKNQSTTYYNYTITDGERPDTLAHKIYGDEEKHWMILLMNDIIDIKSQWPLSYTEFNSFIIEKYGSASTAMATNHSYEKTLKYTIANSDDTYREETITITLSEYNSLTTGIQSFSFGTGKSFSINTTKKQKTKYEYEDELNDSKRIIKILKPEYMNNVMRNMQSILNG
jgi:hypothetical protein